ncbi:hypothetical protein D1BOALGB6SA_831 [Olavius sp. associated proteobacterium Delta 1]|nr:hypothetical protein D1BOALGB6SA_831 [Olavius sp. associated proteobacterium Delta 1]
MMPDNYEGQNRDYEAQNRNYEGTSSPVRGHYEGRA